MTSLFDDLLKQAKSSKSAEINVETAVKPTQSDATDWKARINMLPSSIPAPKITKANSLNGIGSQAKLKEADPPKPSSKVSFRDLMKMASGNKPEGLLVRSADPVLDTKIVRIPKNDSNLLIDTTFTSKPFGSTIQTQPPNSKFQANSKLHLPSKTIKRGKSSNTKRPTGSPVPTHNPKFIKLNTNKRDLTSMEDILNEIKSKKGSDGGISEKKSLNHFSSMKSGKQTIKLNRPTATYKSTRLTESQSERLEPASKKEPVKHIPAPPIVKKSKYFVRKPGQDSRFNNSEGLIIDDENYSDESSDMEAGFFDVEQEERKR